MASTERSTASRFATKVARPQKRAAGRTSVSTTPLQVRPSGMHVDAATRRWIEERTGRQLGKFAGHIERVSVRFRDLNGPRGGGSDLMCRTKVVLSRLPSVIVEGRAETMREAFDQTAASVVRAVRKAVDRASARLPSRRARGFAGGAKTNGGAKRAGAAQGKAVAAKTRNAVEPTGSVVDEGSLIGRRVGASQKNLESALDRPEKRRRTVVIDTAKPGVSASMRRVGNTAEGVSTARRNTKRSAQGMAVALEDSATGKPSRKSTRGAANRLKGAGKLQRRQTRRVTSPQAKALRA